jgi:selenocysteine lyase/cysteine desulfurase
MSVGRRELLTSFGALAAAAAFGRIGAAQGRPRPADGGPGTNGGPAFPRKVDFDIADGSTYINGAYTHPMPRVAVAAMRQNAESRGSLAPSRGGNDQRPDPKALFARLINAKPSEISYIPNTSTGENLVVNGLGIKRFDGNVVTDSLHFDGALIHLLELQKQGLDLRIVKPKDFRIEIRDLEQVVDRKTKLVELSLVTMYNGFQHDLKAVCDLAHAHGAVVYADIVQAAGAVPIDVRATGVDFCACSSFKWLMGDFGLGFLYAREDLLGTAVTRSQWGYHSATTMTGHFPPFDPEFEKTPVSWTRRNDATGYFEVGSIGGGAAAAAAASLGYIHEVGVENIQRHRQPLLRKLQQEMPRLGFTPVTPLDSTSPIVTFAMKDGTPLQRKLQAAKVDVRLSRNWLRLSPSVYNDLRDVDRFLEALS